MLQEIYQIVYSSRATRPIPAEELANILHISRVNNQASDITGMLLYRGGHFLQVLEGSIDQVPALLKKLSRDPRHDNLRTLLEGPIASRAFGTWSMAFRDVSGVEPKELPAYSRFLTKGFSSTECVRYPHKALQMVLAFRNADLERMESLTAEARQFHTPARA